MAVAAYPPIAGWLAPTLPDLNKAIVVRAFHDLGICELPPGSNRSGRIDTYNTRAGSPIGSYWCASWSTAVWEDCGAELPPSSRASCDVLKSWATRRGQFKPAPIEGAMVLYGTPQDASHVGIVIRVKPYLIAIEGNTAFGGFSRNGEAVLVKMVDQSRMLGFCWPTPKE